MVLATLLGGAALPAHAAPATPAVIGCPSLANLRILLRESKADPAKAAARLSDSKAEHLGCAVLGKDAVTALVDHAALNGSAYDCVAVRSTSVCQWTVAGAVTPRAPRRGQAEAAKGTKDKSASDKVSR
ncbi:hypothetical protein SAMN05192565_10445 [Methylobacterium gossipiicola]|uniref:DUF4189 domain-containing protein n=2 Tax=Methylobacterium gossipiicola TaxID=582675 RepID=A0A1I2S5T0_9HYPH|nr:hypothetical protein SAMN05192565_10445 [Methylobacterium gossipiicola]